MRRWSRICATFSEAADREGHVIKPFLVRFSDDQSGATSIEYGLIISLIFLAILGAVTAFGNTSSGIFNVAMNTIRSAMAGGGEADPPAT